MCIRDSILSNREDLAKTLNFGVFPVTQGGPLVHVIAAKAIAFAEAMKPGFYDYQRNVINNAKKFVSEFNKNGIKTTSADTCNHMLMLDLSELNVTGKDIEESLCNANITVNKNSIPNDPRGPRLTSGIRIGTPAITTRGMGSSEIIQISEWISSIIKDHKNETLISKVKENVLALCANFPIYKDTSY